MDCIVANQPVHLYTGGRSPQANQPCVLLLHGAGHDHGVWNFQARQLAHHGFSVLAPDLPGHGRSGGTPLPGIEALADWCGQLLDTLEVSEASVVGHSMGSLIALQLAATAPGRVSRLALVGSVIPMPVAPALLDAAAQRRERAHSMINQWSFAPSAQLGRSALPGMRLTVINRRLMERQAEGCLATDLGACNAYTGGETAAAAVRCPTLLVCGERDLMTPPKATRPLQAALSAVPGGVQVVQLPGSGHAMMSEAPEALGQALRTFLATR